MDEYRITTEQIVEAPRYRICAEFVKALSQDRNIMTRGNSDLFYYGSLCAMAAYEPYLYGDGERERKVFPGGSVVNIARLKRLFRIKTRRQLIEILNDLSDRGLVVYNLLPFADAVHYQIPDWEHSQRIQWICCAGKVCDKGTFFILEETARSLIARGNCSDMTILLDLFCSAVYDDPRVLGSDITPVICLDGEKGRAALPLSMLAERWGISERRVERALETLENAGYIRTTTCGCEEGEITVTLDFYTSVMLRVGQTSLDRALFPLLLTKKAHGPRPESEAMKRRLDAELRELLTTQKIVCAKCERLNSVISEIHGSDHQFYIDYCCKDKPVYRFRVTVSKEEEM